VKDQGGTTEEEKKGASRALYVAVSLLLSLSPRMRKRGRRDGKADGVRGVKYGARGFLGNVLLTDQSPDLWT